MGRYDLKVHLEKLAVRVAGFLVSLLLLQPVYAETGEHEPVPGHEATHDNHRNLVAAFVGVTSKTRRKNGPTLGIGYLRRVTKNFGVGVLVERTTGDLDFWVYAVPFAYLTGPWKAFVAPGIEDSDHHGSELLLRLGGEYAFEFGNWEVAPQLSVDFVDGDQLGVLGVVLGRRF